MTPDQNGNGVPAEDPRAVLEERDRLRGLLRESLPILAAFRNKNPRWTDREFGPQDPYGVHALVPRIRKELGEEG